MYCAKCGKKIAENTKFCTECGAPVNQASENTDAPEPSKNSSKASMFKRLSSHKKGLLVCCLVAVVLIVGIIWSANYFSLENRLTRNAWWSEVTIDQISSNKYSYGGEEGYYSLWCRCLVFNTWGKTNIYRYVPSSGRIYSRYKLDSEDVRNLDWKRSFSGDGDDYEILSHKVLHLGNRYYKWDKNESDDTWYLSGKTLRIGNQYYTAKSPITISDK